MATPGYLPDSTPPGAAPNPTGKPAPVSGGGNPFGGKRAPAFGKKPVGKRAPKGRPMRGTR